jgi:ribosomal protein S11
MGKVAGNFKQAGGDQFSNMIPDGTAFKNLAQKDWEEDDKHKLHIYATKHNTHLCLTKPNRDPIISVSCGNIGFRKAGRGTYDAGYQLAAFLMSRVLDKGLLPQIQKLELVYRGFGPGREAVIGSRRQEDQTADRQVGGFDEAEVRWCQEQEAQEIGLGHGCGGLSRCMELACTIRHHQAYGIWRSNVSTMHTSNQLGVMSNSSAAAPVPRVA